MKELLGLAIILIACDFGLSQAGISFKVCQIGTDPNDPSCYYVARAVTTVEWQGQQNQQVTATVRMTWQLAGPLAGTFSFSSGMVSATAMNQVTANYEQHYQIPTYDNYHASCKGYHTTGQPPELITTGSKNLTHCNLVAGGGSGGGGDCGGEGTVTEDGIWIAEGTSNTCTPILVSLDNEIVHCGGPQSAVYFDLLGEGKPQLLQWVLPGGDDAFLFQDNDGDGLVGDGSELFGSGSMLWLEQARRAPNGFVALAQYDDPRLGGDGDGFLTAADTIWPRLGLWLDADADGVCQPAEVFHPAEAGIGLLETIPGETPLVDPFGNGYRFWAWSFETPQPRGGRQRMVDVFLVRLD